MTALPSACEKALEAIQQDPLDLPLDVLRHVQGCPACAEARVLWLAQEPAPAALAPAGYFDALPGRIHRKLPVRRGGSPRRFLWAAAGILALLAGAGGFLAGRARNIPSQTAEIRPAVEVLEPQVSETPFTDHEEDLAALQKLTAEERKALLTHLKTEKP